MSPVLRSDDLKPTTEEPGCRTPTAAKHRIPEPLTCPPAPRKRRAVDGGHDRRRDAVLFIPSDLESVFAMEKAIWAGSASIPSRSMKLGVSGN
ncbi:hypothetical protein QJS10_CPB04g01138 [Acorus calamus]|uniref:Uncharacterized protein n=1 Tax=Acorus calamus TaxID=4465 RepID=A0AAV9F1C8_ACOCL|nr:hypothetical protein QJS10_CPB04g01138 [Acorus calamus]